MNKLTKRAEDLLKEIIDNRDDEGICDIKYWQERFEKLTTAEDAILRGLFKELKDEEIISVSWADDVPDEIYLLAKGRSYFGEVKENPNIMNTNYFYEKVGHVQIQQNTTNSSQTLNLTQTVDEGKVTELIHMINKYDSMLEVEYGKESADSLRKKVEELELTIKEPKSTNKVKKVLSYIRDLSVNAGGSLIAAGVIQLITSIMG